MVDGQRRRVARDPRGKRTQFEELVIGSDLGSLEFELTQQMVDDSCARLEDYHPWYSLASPWGPTIAPAVMNYSPVRTLFSKAFNVVGLLYKYEFTNISPMMVGQRYTVRGRVSEKWIKNNREFVAYTAECTDAEGSIVWTTRRAHVLDFLTRDVPREGEGMDSARIVQG